MPPEQPGFSYVKERLSGILSCRVSVTPPPPEVVQERDLEVPTRDGTVLRANLYRRRDSGPSPVLISYHPYGKDNLPRRRFGRYLPLVTYRLLRQPERFELSAYTGWEAPDPVVWTDYGYAVLNADMRGFGRSEGQASLFSEQEGEDYHDLIEWAATQPWCDGNVGLSGVSYLALTQWKAAATNPPSLKAICPWEGFTDLYRDLAFPGGIREQGFVNFWFGRLDKTRVRENLVAEQTRHPLCDDFWTSRVADLEAITVPTLVCASFSDHNLHSRGSFEAFRRIGSSQKWLYTHRGGKWATYYSSEAVAAQKRFFDHFLKGRDNGMEGVGPVRLEVRESRDQVVEVREEKEWPPVGTEWRNLYLGGDAGLSAGVPSSGATRVLQFPHERAEFSYRFERDTEVTGPMVLKLRVSIRRARDLCLFVGIRKLRGREHVVFEGSYGFGHDLVTRGWMRVSHREVDAERSLPYRPWHPHRESLPPEPGEVVPVELELLPSSTLYRAGDILRLDIQGHYFFKRHPLLGQFPAGYESSPPGELTLHLGAEFDSHLLLPVK